jgi:hypothetical protein
MKYLIPLDGTKSALEPIDHLERMARCGVRVEAILLNVQPVFHRHIAQFTLRRNRDAWRKERSLVAMQPAADRLAAAGIPYRMIAEAGNPDERIAAVAAAERVDDILKGEKQGPVERYFVPASLAGLAALLLAAD